MASLGFFMGGACAAAGCLDVAVLASCDVMPSSVCSLIQANGKSSSTPRDGVMFAVVCSSVFSLVSAVIVTCGWDLTERTLLAKLFKCREGKYDSKICRFGDFLSIAEMYSRSQVSVDGLNSRSAPC